MQLGFVIDQSRCIGCHACTVACKSENDVPLGTFRTWVKYTEKGTFPEVKRSFTVLRCNQCTDAPCVTICPVRALEKGANGSIDVDPQACIGCKACMQGCPYDAMYINTGTGTAQKCHFCNHRVESGLAPACVVVCPTEALIPGDFHDPNSRVSRLRKAEPLTARKVQAGTGPNVFYKAADSAGLDPLQTNAAGGFLWSNQTPSLQLESQQWEAMQEKAEARTVYDIGKNLLWGGKVSAYLFTKSLAAGIFLAAALAGLATDAWTTARMTGAAAGALLFLVITTVLLVGDLKRPERFLYILTRPNWSSWLARGSIVLMGFGALLSLQIAWGLLGSASGLAWAALTMLTAIAGMLSAAYTAWLFAQSKGRVLWMRRGLALHLVVQALVAGSAVLLVWVVWLQPNVTLATVFNRLLVGSLALHIGITLLEGRAAPARRAAEYHRVSRLITRGPFAARHWQAVLLGGFAPMLLLMVPGQASMHALVALTALVGLYFEEDIMVRAGQALPIS
jgi:Fe-S-cluster-containing dehydrogenase component/formate-dependent nitrite reductase membrane component NrfD